MSSKSDKFEQDVAKHINGQMGIKASRPSVSAAYSDIKLEYKHQHYWLEVKMNHTDNLSNPRFFYASGKWQTTYKTPSASFGVQVLNHCKQTKRFIEEIAKYSGIPKAKIELHSSKAGLRRPNAVPLEVLREYFEQPGKNRYIADEKDTDLGKLVTEHYTIGKEEPAYYMQAGDDFYRISNRNPLGLTTQIPLLAGDGDFKVRIGTRAEFYEIQAEIKIKEMPESKFSCLPGTKKINPFHTLKKK